MKICFAVCEYNPFHNGHLYHLDYIKKEIKPDYIVIVMSGNFTQRGEIAVMDKYTRATHAIKAGADAVIELPTVFATANAEIFAKGAIKLINCCGGEKHICFGTESGEKTKLLSTAAALLEESREFKKLYKEELKTGVTAIKAKCAALEKMKVENLDFELLKTPNNILGIEYCKAILSSKADVEIHPVIRQGAAYNDDKMYKNLSSAAAIRKAVNDGKRRQIKKCVPDYVFRDLPAKLPDADDLIFFSAIKSTPKELERVLDCTEGLENRIKALTRDADGLDKLVEKIKTKRYTKTRLERILLANMLGIEESFVRKCLNSELYLKILAVNKDKLDVLSAIRGKNDVPVITRKSDCKKLSGVAKDCFLTDVDALEIFDFVAKTKTNEFEMKTV